MKHLRGLHLVDPKFRVSGHVNVLLVVDVFNSTVLHGRQFGPLDSPLVLETCFGWALSGASNRNKQQYSSLALGNSPRQFSDRKEYFGKRDQQTRKTI